MDQFLVVVASVVLAGSVWGSYRTFAPPSGEGTSPSVGKIDSLVGEVRWRPTARPFWSQAGLGDTLRQGDSLYAQPGSHVVVVLEDGTQLAVSERSLISLSGADKPDEPRVSVMLGRLVAKAQSALGVGVGAVTAQLSAGAEVEMTATQESARVVPLAGQVKVGGAMVAEGSAAVARDGATQPEVFEAPLVFPTASSVSFVGEEGATISFRWLNAPRAQLVIALDRGFENVEQTVQASDSVAVVEALAPGAYYWRVVDPESGAVLSVDRALTVVLDAPPHLVKPVNAAVLYLPGGRFTHFVWTPVADVPLYEWQLASDRGFTQVVAQRRVAGPQLRFDGDGLAEGVYFWRVRGVSFSREAPVSPTRVFRLITKPLPRAPRLFDPELQIREEPAPPAPGPEQGLWVPHLMKGINWLLGVKEAHAATRGRRAKIVLRWEPVPGVNRYELQIAAEEGFKNIVVKETLGSTYYVWQEVPTRPHWWRVRSIDADGRLGLFSSPQKIAPALPSPELLAPSDGARRRISHSSRRIGFSWKAEGLAATYELEVASERGFQRIVLREQVSSASFSWAPPHAGSFYWRVRARDAYGKTTDYSKSRLVRVGVETPQWEGARETFGLGRPVTLRVAPVVLAQSYTLQIRNRARGVLHEARSGSGAFTWTPKAMGEYVAVVRASSGGVPSAWNEPLAFEVRMAAPEFVKPAGEVVRLEKDEAVVVGWTSVEGAAGYEVVVEGEGEAPTTLRTEETQIDLGPLRGRVTVRLSSVDGAGGRIDGEPKDLVLVDTLTAPQVEVWPSERVWAPGDALRLAWTEVPGALSYTVEVAPDAPGAPQWSAIQAEGPPLSYVMDAPGRFLWRVRGIDAVGEVGPPSDPEYFVIQEAAPPPPPEAHSNFLVGVGLGLSMGFQASFEPSFHGDLGWKLTHRKASAPEEVEPRFDVWAHIRLGYQTGEVSGTALSARQHALPVRLGVMTTWRGNVVDLYGGAGLAVGILRATLDGAGQPEIARTSVYPGVQGSGGVAYAIGPGQVYGEAQLTWLREDARRVVFDSSGVSLLFGYRIRL